MNELVQDAFDTAVAGMKAQRESVQFNFVAELEALTERYVADPLARVDLQIGIVNLISRYIEQRLLRRPNSFGASC